MDELEVHEDAPLPELHEAEIDAETVARLFADVGACTTLLSVSCKGGPERTATSSDGLADAAGALLSGQVVGVQLRYRHQGKEWWDTILSMGTRFRVVRIEAPG